MPETMNVSTDTEKAQLTIERTFNAGRDLVFKAFTEPDRIKQWWGPRQWQTQNAAMDVRPGGVWHYVMTGPDGTEAWGRAVYREIVPPERLVYLDQFSDKDGNAAAGMPELVITITFTETEGKTRMTMVCQFENAEQLKALLEMQMVEGMTSSLDRLEEYLAP